MDLWILDDQYQRSSIYDGYISLIWTDRYTAYGDFELVTTNSQEARGLFKDGTKLGIYSSDRVMLVETVEETRSDSGENLLKIKGRSLESIMEQRIAISAAMLSGIGSTPKWVFSAYRPHETMALLYKTVLYDGALNVNDVFSSVPWLSVYSEGILFPPDVVRFEFEPDTVYNSIKKVADLYNIGFRIKWYKDSGSLRFTVYTGTDRSSGQTTAPSVVFDENTDSLTNVSSLRSTAGMKTVALILSKNASAWVYADNYDPASKGLLRRVVTGTIDSDLPAGADLNALMLQKGKELLGEHRPIIGFDGEVPQNSTYKYGVDYGLGDLVELRDSSGNINVMRVTEQIFVSDKEGIRSYPTLTFDMLITPGTWLARPANQQWADVTTETWAQA